MIIDAHCHIYPDKIADKAAHSTGRFYSLPDSENLRAAVEELVSLGLGGVKLHPDIQQFKLDDYRCLKIYELCEEFNLPVLLHTGDSRYDYSNPNRLIPILNIYDKMVVVGAHFGGWSM